MDVVSGILLVTGASLALVAGIGLQRLPDVFARMHAATKPATLGLTLVLTGAALQMSEVGSVAKLLLVVVLQFATAPIGSHLVGRAAYNAGTESEDVEIDQLAGVDVDGTAPPTDATS